MKRSRRNFLKISGLCALGMGVKPVIDAFAETGQAMVMPNPKALVGKRWGMVVNIRKCRDDCNDCINACHTAHNVPHFTNPKDEIKWIWHEGYDNAFPGTESDYMEEGLEQKKLMVLCNHCDNPPCVRVCPVQATFKNPADGIVMMDFHRCIGCRCCMAACPYGSRSFNWRDPRTALPEITNPDFPTRTKGVVEKCNFCTERLAEGLMPACVEACKEEALVFGDLNDPDSEIRAVLREHFTIRRKPELGTRPQVYYIV